MLENSGAEVSTPSNVVSLKEAQSKRLPSLKEIALADPEIRAFLKLIHDEDLREQAVSLLEKAIAKSSRVMPQRPVVPEARS
jgi:hypothetical protein